MKQHPKEIKIRTSHTNTYILNLSKKILNKESCPKLFKENLYRASLEKTYDTETYPASVASIITSANYGEKLLKYFILNNPSKGTLREYVQFIRNERDTMFKNSYRKSSNKFVSIYPFKRTTSLLYFYLLTFKGKQND